MNDFCTGSNLSRASSGFEYARLDFRNAQVLEDTRLDPVEGEGREVIQSFPQTKISVCGHLVHPVDRSKMRSGLDCLRVRLDNFLDCQNRIGKTIEFFLSITFGWLDHEAENLRECNGGGMKAKVQKELADLGNGFGLRDTGLFQFLEIFIAES